MAGQQHGRGGADLPDDWDRAYVGTPPWDIGRPQQPFVALADAGALRGEVLDLGCGTGEHALLAASLGLRATGIDVAPTAVERARAKAAERGLDATFLVHDVTALASLDDRYDTVLDCGLFHVLDDADRERLVAGLRVVMRPGGALHLLCFSDRVPGDAGPRRISEPELRSAFRDGFTVQAVAAASIEATFMPDPVPAWLATVIRDG